MLSRTKELCYLTSFVIRLFEDAEKVGLWNEPSTCCRCCEQPTVRVWLHPRCQCSAKTVVRAPVVFVLGIVPCRASSLGVLCEGFY